MPSILNIILFVFWQVPPSIFIASGRGQASFWHILILIIYEVCGLALSFGRKVWERIQEKLVGWAANRAESVITYRSFHHRYIEYVKSNHVFFNVTGLRSIDPLKFEQVFVELQIESSSAYERMGILSPLREKKVLEGNHSIWDFLRQYQSQRNTPLALVIKGPPGEVLNNLCK